MAARGKLNENGPSTIYALRSAAAKRKWKSRQKIWSRGYGAEAASPINPDAETLLLLVYTSSEDIAFTVFLESRNAKIR